MWCPPLEEASPSGVGQSRRSLMHVSLRPHAWPSCVGGVPCVEGHWWELVGTACWDRWPPSSQLGSARYLRRAVAAAGGAHLHVDIARLDTRPGLGQGGVKEGDRTADRIACWWPHGTLDAVRCPEKPQRRLSERVAGVPISNWRCVECCVVCVCGLCPVVCMDARARATTT